MAYQVIARKWRPQTFEEVTGQEPITRTLRGAIEHERLHHAYLFSGARGVGKTTTARLLAKALNCHRSDRPTPTPCALTDENACPSCREIAEGRSIDVLEIDAASNTGVGNVRDAIIDTIGVRAARDRYKVFIIDEVHMLSNQAFNALLKTLEEPPPRVLFIMATTESHKVPDTILSRSQQFEFRTITTAKIAERLRHIADAERIEVSPDALREIARAGEGSMRDAQSAFDQVISFSEGRIETQDVETALGIASVELRARVMRAIADAAPADALAVVDDLAMRGHDLRNFSRDLLAHLRDLLVVKVLGDSAAGSVDASEQERRVLLQEAEAFSESDLVRFFHSLTETEKHLRESAHPRYQLEIGLVKLIEMRRLAPLGQIVERLNALEETLRTGRAPAGHSGAPSSPPSPASPATGGTGGAPPRRSSSGSSSSSSSGVGVGSSSLEGLSDGVKEISIGASDAAAASLEKMGGNLSASAPVRNAPAPPPETSAPTVKDKTSAPAAKEKTTARTFAPPRIPSFAAPKSSNATQTTSPAPPPAPVAPPPFVSSFAPPAPGLKLVPTQANGGRDSSSSPNTVGSGNGVDAPFPLSNVAAPSTLQANDTEPLDAPRNNYYAPFEYYSNPSAPTPEPTFFDEPPSPSFLNAPVVNSNGGASKIYGDVSADTHAGASTAAGAGSSQALDDSVARIRKSLDDKRKPLLAIVLEGARRVCVEGDELYVEFAPEGKHLRDTLAKPDNVRILREACCEVMGREMGVRLIVKEAFETDDGMRTQQDEERLEKTRLREWAESQPVVQELLKTFRAEIIDVRRIEGEATKPAPPANK